MASIRRFKGRCVSLSLFPAIILCILSSYVFAEAQPDQASQAQRYRVYALKHISGPQCKEFLEQMQLGTVSQLPGKNNAVLVTASQADLVKVTAVVNLIDSESKFASDAICPASQLTHVPSRKELEKSLGGSIAIGTFIDPPPLSAPVKAIVDVYNDKVIAIAPASQFEKIAVAVREFQSSAASTPRPAESESLQELAATAEPQKTAVSPNKPKETQKASETGEDLFGKLINSLDEAEKKAAEEKKAADANKAAEKAQQSVQMAQLPKEAEVTGVIIPKSTEPNLQRPKAAMAEPNKTVLTIGSSTPAQKAAESTEQVSYEPEPNAAIVNETLDLNLPESLEIVQLLTLVGDYLHLDYMYDPTKVNGTVNLKLRGPIKVKELYPLVESVLRFKGLAMTRRGNLVTIVPTSEALDIDPTLLSAGGAKIQYGDVVVTRFFNVQYIDTTNAKNLLDGMKLGVNITPITETSTLIVTGYAYRMSRIEELLNIIDKPGPPKQFRFRPLRYTMAATLAPKVKALVEQLGEMSITVGATSGTAPTMPPGRHAPTRTTPPQAGGGEAAGKPSVYLDADERTNRLMMIGFDEQLNTVEQIVGALDVEKQDLRTIRLYDIQRVGAEEVKNKLIELGVIGGELQTSPYRGSQTRITRPPDQAAAQQAGQPGAAGGTGAVTLDQPIVVIIESTNSLLVNATPEQHTQIASIISYVDTETLEKAVPYEIYALENQDPKNMAEVLTKLIQETTKDKEGKIEKVTKKIDEDIIIVPDENTFSIIVYASRKNQEWIKKLITSLDRRRPQVLIDVTLVEITRGDTFNYDLNIIGAASGAATLVKNNAILKPFLNDSNQSGNRVEMSSDKTNGGQAFYTDKHVQALLTAIQTKSYGRVLAKPKILVDDGSEGDIQTKSTTSYQTQTVQVPTTGSAIQATNFATVDATIELKITPHISEGELLRLDISMSRDDFGTRPAVDGPPDKVSSLVKTTVFVPDDKTVILGGLVKLNQTKGGSKVPILGDIPLIGGLFRSANDTDTESKLYVFLKANIVRPAAEGKLHDLQEISEEHRRAFEKSERHFQRNEDWSGIKPKPMEPNKVLEEL